MNTPDRETHTLVIDTSPTSRILLCSLLRKCDCEPAATLASPEEAAPYLQGRQWDVVFLHLPLLSDADNRAKEVLAPVRRSARMLVVMTDGVTGDIRSELLEAGADAVLEKPLTLSDMRSLCSSLFHQSNPTLLDTGTALSVMGNDKEVFREVYQMFMEQHPLTIITLRSSLEAGKFEEGRQAAHTLKNYFRTIGAFSCGNITETIERALKVRDAPAAARALDCFDSEYAKLIPLLQLA